MIPPLVHFTPRSLRLGGPDYRGVPGEYIVLRRSKRARGAQLCPYARSLRRRGFKCNFCIHTTLARCIFHVDCDDLYAKITGVGYIAGEASRNTNRNFASVWQDGTFKWVETIVAS